MRIKDGVPIEQTRPLFVVGLPRSGTTLLRNLLNGHSDVAMTAYESHFVPSVLRQYGAVPHFKSPEEANRFVRRFKQGLLYRKGVERGTFKPSDEEVAASLRGTSWAEILRALFGLYCETDITTMKVWGDKTPGYLDHLDLIESALPGVRFAHIVRDPRDQALSVRAAWGKSLRRSAEKWRREIVSARGSRAACDRRYIEVRYEDLVSDPRAELMRLCDWLEIDYQPAMLTAGAGSDELGQMVGVEEISTAAIGGRREWLSAREEAAIASLVGDVGSSLAYELPPTQSRELGPVERAALAAHDRIAHIRYFIRGRGVIDGSKMVLGTLIDSLGSK